MDVILLERVARLGQMGETVRVRDGYARNFLLPRGKALRATQANMKRFENQRADLEARNLEAKGEAEGVHKTLNGESFIVIRQAGESGQLYGSVSPRDIAEAMKEGGFIIHRGQVELTQPIKTIGLHDVAIRLHPEVEATVSINVARSQDEATRQSRGEDLTQRRDEEDEDIERLFEGRSEDEDEETDAETGETAEAPLEEDGEKRAED